MRSVVAFEIPFLFYCIFLFYHIPKQIVLLNWKNNFLSLLLHIFYIYLFYQVHPFDITNYTKNFLFIGCSVDIFILFSHAVVCFFTIIFKEVNYLSFPNYTCLIEVWVILVEFRYFIQFVKDFFFFSNNLEHFFWLLYCNLLIILI